MLHHDVHPSSQKERGTEEELIHDLRKLVRTYAHEGKVIAFDLVQLRTRPAA